MDAPGIVVGTMGLAQSRAYRMVMEVGNLDRIVIFDLDGTLADCSHRLCHIKEKGTDWDKFFEKLEDDSPHEWAVKLATTLGNAGFQIYIVTARPYRLFQRTHDWLEKNNVPFRGLLMRDDKDHREDYLVKRDILLKSFDKTKIELVIDDRDQVVKMWRDEGLNCLQCPPAH